jgi:predicted PurR-regulated permease PerM
LTFYLLLNGRGLYAWVLAFVPRALRERVALTAGEVTVVIQAYVRGQLIAALLFATYAALVLSLLGVPAVGPLALIAGVFDVIPVLGILIATVPALALALTVSPATALWVAIAYVGYHLFETYILLPRVYGTRLRISTLSVLLALLVGGSLQGVAGAFLALPLVATYPVIERRWLARYLRSRVVTDHSALAAAVEQDSDVAINAVLLGERHASETLSRTGAVIS